MDTWGGGGRNKQEQYIGGHTRDIETGTIHWGTYTRYRNRNDMWGGGGRNKQEQYIWGNTRGIETGTIRGEGVVGINRNNTLWDKH